MLKKPESRWQVRKKYVLSLAILIILVFLIYIILFTHHYKSTELSSPLPVSSPPLSQPSLLLSPSIPSVPNSASLNMLKMLWNHRILHDDDPEIIKRYKKSWIGGNLMHRKKELLLWGSMANMNNILPNPTICEIGYAYGFSAVVILSSNPTAKYVGFDIGRNESRDAWNMMKAIYRDRATIIWGDSSTNIEKLKKDNIENIVCDIWIIDGDHSYNGAKRDIDAIINTASKLTRKYPNNLIIWDDCDLGDAPFNAAHIDAVIIDKHWPIKDAGGAARGPTQVFTEDIMAKQFLYVSHGFEKDSRGKRVTWCISMIK